MKVETNPSELSLRDEVLVGCVVGPLTFEFEFEFELEFEFEFAFAFEYKFEFAFEFEDEGRILETALLIILSYVVL